LRERRLHVSWCAVLDFYWFINTPQEQLQNQPAAIKNQQITCKYPEAVVREAAAGFYYAEAAEAAASLGVGRFLLQPGGTHHLALNTIRSQITFESIRCFVLNFPLNN
jgi:hypothetical protein